MSELSDELVDITLTSPPFYDDELYILDGGRIEFGWKTYGEYLDHLSQVFSEIYRITKFSGKLILVLSNSPKININSEIDYYWPCLHDLISICHKFGWKLIDEIVWIQEKPVYETLPKAIPNVRMQPFHNWISIMQKPGSNDEIAGNVINQSSVWYMDSEDPIGEYNESYGSFPDELIERCLKFWSCNREIVLDPYAGSGQTIRIAKKMNRIGIGFEVDKKWEHLWIDINE